VSLFFSPLSTRRRAIAVGLQVGVFPLNFVFVSTSERSFGPQAAVLSSSLPSLSALEPTVFFFRDFFLFSLWDFSLPSVLSFCSSRMTATLASPFFLHPVDFLFFEFSIIVRRFIKYGSRFGSSVPFFLGRKYFPLPRSRPPIFPCFLKGSFSPPHLSLSIFPSSFVRGFRVSFPPPFFREIERAPPYKRLLFKVPHGVPLCFFQKGRCPSFHVFLQTGSRYPSLKCSLQTRSALRLMKLSLLGPR